MKSTFEKMGGTYTLGADGIYYPNQDNARDTTQKESPPPAQ